jgi:hypothetical protein
MSFDSFNADALAEVTAVMGSPFTYKGAVYTGVINDLETTSILIEGGLLENLVTIIVVQKCDLPARPAVGETILIGDKTVRIENVKGDESSWELHCKTGAT